MSRTAFAFAIILASAPASGQERRAWDSREFSITFFLQEPVRTRVLWASRDGGKTWRTAKDAGVSEAWKEWKDKRIVCNVRVPDDGAWDFFAQFGDAVSNLSPEPQPGQPADPHLRMDIRAAASIDLTSPKPGEELIGGNQVIVRWTSDPKGLREKSGLLYVQLNAQPWKAVATNLDLSGEYLWVLPSATAPLKIRFRVGAFTKDQREVSSKDVEATLLAGTTVAGLSWETPKGPTEWTGGASVTVRWRSLGIEFRERSAELQYAIGGEPWIPITKGLEPTGSYAWVVPNRDTAELRLRVRALTRTGQEGLAVSDPVSVRAAGRPNVAEARALYDRARVLAAQQRSAEARLKYEEALAAWADFAEALNDLGKLYADQKDAAKALEYFLRARRACPSDPTAYVNAALMETRLGLLDDALANLKDALALGFDGDERNAVLAGETLWRIASVSSEAQDWKRARAAAEMILRIRQASRPTKGKAAEFVEWLKKR